MFLGGLVNDIRDRIAGCLLGGAIGDALGAGIEFDSITEIRRAHGPTGVTDYVEAYGRRGAITDDTQMTLFTVEGIIRASVRARAKGICNPANVVRHAYLRWYHTQGHRWPDDEFAGGPDGWLITVEDLHHGRAPGNTCLSAMAQGGTGEPDEPINTSKGCGGVMRAAPAGFVNWDAPRTRDAKNVKQHAAFIEAVGLDSPLHEELIDWFRTIPLWLELDGLRVIHACWSEPDLAQLRPLVSSENTLTKQLVVDASTAGHPAYTSVETLLKGPELLIPYGMWFRDKGKHERHHVRMKWWDDSATTWKSLLPAGTPIFTRDKRRVEALPDEPLGDAGTSLYTGDTPVIFGHYWFEAPLALTNPKALCVDYSAGAGEPLVAYRFDGEPELDEHKLLSCRT